MENPIIEGYELTIIFDGDTPVFFPNKNKKEKLTHLSITPVWYEEKDGFLVIEIEDFQFMKYSLKNITSYAYTKELK